MTISTGLAAVLLAVGFAPPDSADTMGRAGPRPETRWAEAVGLRLLYSLSGYQGTQPESLAMMDAVMNMEIGAGQGWFQPGQTRLGWRWLAEHMDADGDGVITPAEFRGPAEFFKRLDRNGDGVLTPADFDWSFKPPPAPPRKSSAKGPPPGSGMPSREILLNGLFTGEIGSPYEGARVGTRAPRFVLPTHDGTRKVALADHIGAKPIVLIFGSLT